MKDQIVELCLLRRSNQINRDEFGKRLLAMMLADPDAIENIAIDVEALFLKASDQ